MSDPEKSSEKPSLGRNKKGKFTKGNKGGPGNPYIRQQREWAKRFYRAITPEDFSDVMDALIAQAKAGEKWAVIEVLNRTLGKPKEQIDLSVKGTISIEQRVQGFLSALGISQAPPSSVPTSLVDGEEVCPLRALPGPEPEPYSDEAQPGPQDGGGDAEGDGGDGPVPALPDEVDGGPAPDRVRGEE